MREYFELFFSNTYDAILLIDEASSHIIDCNETALELFEINKKESIIGFPWWSLSKVHVSRQEMSYMRDIIHQDKRFSFVKESTTEKGKIFISEINISLFENEERNYLLTRISNITDQYEAKQSLKLSEEKNISLLNAIPDLMFVINRDGIYEDFKSYNRALLIDPEDSIIGRKVTDTKLPSEVGNLILDNVQTVLKTSELQQFEYSLDFNGSIKHLEARMTKVNAQAVLSIVRDITELKEYRKLLVESNLRLTTVLDNIDHLVYNISIGPSGEKNIKYISPQIEKLYGFTVDEYITLVKSGNVMNYYHPEDLEDIVKKSKVLKDKKEVQTLVYRFKPKHAKEYIYIEESVFPQFSKKGMHISNLGIARDVTERILSEEKIRISEKSYRDMFNYSTDLLYVLDNKFKILDFNKAVEERTGLKDDDLFGKLPNFFVQVSKEGKEEIEEKLTEAWKFGSLTVDWWCEDSDGMQFPVELIISRSQYFGQDVLVVTGRDISERLRSQRVIEESRRSFKNLVDNSPNGIVIHAEGTILYVNPSVLNMFGLDAEDEDVLIGQGTYSNHLYDMLTDDSKEVMLDRASYYERGILPPTQEVMGIGADGTSLHMELESVFTDYQGQKSIQTFWYNLEDRKKFEKERLRAEVAEETNVQLEKEIQNHKKTQQILIETRSFVEYMFSSSLDMIIAADLDQKITNISPSAQQLFGYAKEDLIGQEYSTLYADIKEYQKLKKQIDRTGKYSGEINSLKRDGSSFPAYLSASTVQDKDGKVLGLMGVSRDITEIKKAEQRLVSSERRYRELFENMIEAIFVMDSDLTVQQMNKAAMNLLEVKKKEIGGLKVIDFVHEDDEPFFSSYFSELSKGKNPAEIQVRLVSIQRSVKHVNVSAYKVEQNGETVGYRGLFRDITESKEAAEVIKEQSSKIESIFENTSNMMIWTLDKELNITSYNSNFKSVITNKFGSSVDIGYSFADAIKSRVEEKDFDELIHHYRSALAGTAKNFEVPMTTDSEQLVWIDTFLNPIRLEGDALKEIACIAFEITDKKRAEQELKLSLKEKEILLKEVHHRVKNNLQVISSILNLQSSYVKEQSTLDILRESQNRIKSMSFIHESLYHTKNFSSINFSEYISNLSKNLVHSYRLTGSNIELNLGVNEVSLSLDQAIPCGLIVNELVSNALKYAFPNDKGGISILLSRHDNEIHLQVEDDGIGLPDDLDPENTDTLGLQLVFTLVEQLDGKLDLRSENGTKYLLKFVLDN